jgi:hypothetical protein
MFTKTGGFALRYRIERKPIKLPNGEELVLDKKGIYDKNGKLKYTRDGYIRKRYDMNGDPKDDGKFNAVGV